MNIYKMLKRLLQERQYENYTKEDSEGEAVTVIVISLVNTIVKHPVRYKRQAILGAIVKNVESNYLLFHVCLFVRLSSSYSTDSNGRIFMKFHI
jgi:hypothetical protein